MSRPHRSGLTIAEREADVLASLASPEIRGRSEGWTTPMWIGGTDASHHSATLGRLVRRGLVEKRPRGCGSMLYRITAEGLRATAAKGAGDV